MSSIENDLNDFNQFAKTHISSGAAPSIDELFDKWRIQNPPDEDLLAIQASLNDLDSGERGTLADEFNQKMASKYKLD